MSNKKTRIWLTVMMVLVCFLITACGCKHEETERINAKLATCTEDGYTGDTQCLSCEKVIAKGEMIPATGHTKGNPTDVIEATCTADGYTGNVYCVTCGEMLTKGETIAMIAHTPDDVHNAAEATCAKEGYTGDVLCKVCGTMLSQGQTIAKPEHTPENQPRNASVPTCTQDGYTGDIYCSVCSTPVTSGSVIPATGHSWGEAIGVVEPTCLLEGYSGDQTCVVCGYIEMGTVTERLLHDFVNNTCTVCGWRVAGLYNDGELVFDWQQLLDNGLIKMEENEPNRLVKAGKQLKGALVISDTVNSIGAFAFYMHENITEVYIPSSVAAIYDHAFYQSGIENVQFASGKTELVGSEIFSDCNSLKEITLPEGLTVVPEKCFGWCDNLAKVHFPSTLKEIDSSAFSGCVALDAVEFPQGLESIGGNAFSQTSIKEISLPSSVKTIGYSIHTDSCFTYVSTLETVDMSNCQVTELPSFAGNKNLRVIHLPQSLISCSNRAFNETKIEELVLPRGFETVSDTIGLSTLKTIIWPFSLMKNPFGKKTTPETIYYEGTEAQWNALIGVDAFPTATIMFNYSYEEGIE